MEPCEFGAVNHSVHSAKVNEYSVGCHALYGARVVLADFDFVPESLFARFAFFSCNNADGAENSAAGCVEVDYLEFLCCSDERRKVAVARNCRLRCGNEYTLRKSADNYAALDRFRNSAFKNRSVLKSFLYTFPVICGSDLLGGEVSNTVDVADSVCNSLYLISYLKKIFELSLRIVCDVVKREHACAFRADVNTDFGAGNGHDVSHDGISCTDIFERFVKKLREIFMFAHNCLYLLDYVARS